jgi:hypothetical protein
VAEVVKGDGDSCARACSEALSVRVEAWWFGFGGEELMEVKTVEVNDGTVEGLLVIAELEMPASLSRR